MDPVKAGFDSLMNHLSCLQQCLLASRPHIAMVSRIPGVHKGQEHEVIHTITPEHHYGQYAVDLTNEGYQDLHIQYPYSQKAARRYVGVIQLAFNTPYSQDIVTLIQQINQIKTDIAQWVINEHHTRQARFDAVHQPCPGVMTTHLYRHIHCLVEENISSIKFTWQRKDALHKPDKASLLKNLHEELTRTPADHSLALNQLITKIASTPAALLRIRRNVKVQPAANVLTESGLKTLNAPLPIIVIQDTPLHTDVIANFDANARRKPRADKRRAILLGTFAGQQIEQMAPQ